MIWFLNTVRAFLCEKACLILLSTLVSKWYDFLDTSKKTWWFNFYQKLVLCKLSKKNPFICRWQTVLNLSEKSDLKIYFGFVFSFDNDWKSFSTPVNKIDHYLEIFDHAGVKKSYFWPFLGHFGRSSLLNVNLWCVSKALC